MVCRVGSFLDEVACSFAIRVCTGRIGGTFHGETIPSTQGSCHPRREPLHIGPRPRSSLCGRNVVYRVSFSLFFIDIFPVAFTPHIYMYVCYVISLLMFAFCLGSGGITRYTPTAVYLTFEFICRCYGSEFPSVAGGSISDMLEVKRMHCQMRGLSTKWLVTILSMSKQINLGCGISNNNPHRTAARQ